jgi:hypothetical protein
MSNSNPRLNVTVTPEQHAMLLELGALQERSAASFLREMLDTATPMLAALLPVYRAAAAQQAIQPQALQMAIRDALEGVEANRAQLSLLDQLGTVQPANSHGGPERSPASSEAREDAAPARHRRKSAS